MPAISVFMSYARADDAATYGRITKLKEDVQNSYAALSGESVGVFQDTDSISLGEVWRDRIRAGLTSSSILLAVVSAAFLRSAACREELREFLGFLETGKNQRLIIPLIFGDPERLETHFSDDDIWRELSTLQRLNVQDLRIADPGTALWLSNVELIASRIEEVLAEAARSDKAPVPVVTDEVEDGPPGIMEIFVDLEEASPRFVGALEQFMEVFASFQEVIETEGANMTKAQNFSQRLATTTRLANSLKPIADRASGISASLKRDVGSLDVAVRTAVQLTRAGTWDTSDPKVISGLGAVQDLATTGLDSLSHLENLTEAIDSGMGLSAKLDAPLKRIKASILIFAEMRGIFKGWIDELDAIEQQ